MNKANKLIMITLFCISVFSVVIMECAAETTTVAISPSTSELPVSQIGQSFSVNITVVGVTGLNSWSSQVSWDPSVLNLTTVREGPFLKNSGTLTTIFPWSREGATVDSGLTQIDDIILGYDSVNGSGTLATLSFTVLKSGNSTIGLNATRLLQPGPDHLPITFTPVNGTLTILANNPEPDEWAVNITSTAGGVTTPSGNLNVTVGNQLNVTATANSGYIFSHWLFDTQNYGANNQITLPSQSKGSSHTLQAVFNQTSPSPEPQPKPEPEPSPQTSPTSTQTKPPAHEGLSPEFYFVIGAGIVFSFLLISAVVLQRRKK